MTMNVHVNEFKSMIGGNSSKHRQAADAISNIIKTICPTTEAFKIEAYNFNGMYGDYTLGNVATSNNSQHLTTIMNFYSDSKANNGSELIEDKYGKTLLPVGDGKLILDEEGYMVAEYRENINDGNNSMLNILVDVFNESRWDLFKHIMSEFNKMVIIPIANKYSWKKTSNKEALSKSILEVASQQQKQIIADLRYKQNQYEDNIRNYKNKLRREYDVLYISMRSLDKELENDTNVYDKVLKDIELMVQNEKIDDVLLKGDRIIIVTTPLIIHASDGNNYFGGVYNVEIPFLNSDVRFKSSNGRQGYWTSHDPHPHVNGNDGHACLGNIDSTIAELSAQKEIYAIALTCIDFLESANVTDSAGRRVINWDRVNDDGTVLSPNDRNRRCNSCGDMFYEEDLARVYGTIRYTNDDGDYELIDERFVCDECREDSYLYDEHSDEYALNIEEYDDDEDYDEEEDDN